MKPLLRKKMQALNSPKLSHHFHLDAHADYLSWRAQKLAAYPLELLITEIKNPYQLTSSERTQLLTQCQKVNFALYQFTADTPVDKTTLQALATQLGLTRIDRHLIADETGITALQVASHGQAQAYIPYTNRPLNWHTDGYYNPFSQQVHAILMHCVRPALQGGESQLFDHELAYIQLRDQNPDYIAALMAPQAMTVPANHKDGVEIRPLQSGPVFSIHSPSNTLHMRYTARSRHIIWPQDAPTQAALTALTQLFQDASPYIVRHRLTTNQGIVCNNILHSRSKFTEGDTVEQQRLLYRIRFLDRISAP